MDHATVRESILGLRSIVGQGSELKRTIMMGSDYYESTASASAHQAKGQPAVGIGHGARIENAIIDKNARVGDNCVISPAGKAQDADHERYYVRDGIIIIPKNGMVPSGSVL